MRRLMPLFSGVRGLIAVLIAGLLVQLLILAWIFAARVAEVRESTAAMPSTMLLSLGERLRPLTQAQRADWADLVSLENLELRLTDQRPERPPPINALERALGVSTVWASLEIGEGQYIVLSRRAAISEAYGFIGQVGLVILTFFALIIVILLRARAALVPVRQFAAAAERLSNDLHAKPLPETGRGELRQAAQAVNKMQFSLQEQAAARSRLIAGIGHDLRTYITRLTLRAETMTDPVQRHKALKDLSDMAEVINQSLDLGRADQPAEQTTKMALGAFVQDVVSAYAETGQPVRLADIPRLTVMARPVALRRALENMIGNALRYGQTATLRVEAREMWAHILIDDEGPGIPAEERENVLKPYVRLETSRNRETGGTGLGLAVTQALMHQQGGALELDEAPSGGLRIRLILPQVRIAPNVTA